MGGGTSGTVPSPYKGRKSVGIVFKASDHPNPAPGKYVLVIKSNFPVVSVETLRNSMPKLKNGSKQNNLAMIGGVLSLYHIYPIYPVEKTKLSKSKPKTNTKIPAKRPLPALLKKVQINKPNATIAIPNSKNIVNRKVMSVFVKELKRNSQPEAQVVTEPTVTSNVEDNIVLTQ